MLRARDALYRGFVEAARREESGFLRVIADHYVWDVLSVFHAYALHRRFRSLGIEPIGLGKEEIVPRIRQQQRPASNSLLTQLRDGPPRGRSWVPSYVRQVRWTMHLNGFSPASLRPFHPVLDIATTQVDPLVRVHASIVPQTVKYLPAQSWFSLAGGRSEPSRDVAPSTAESVLSAIEDCFAQAGEQVRPFLREYFADSLSEGMRLAAIHAAALGERRNLPSLLWNGTGGSLWNRLLRRAVRAGGGITTGHDHSTGSGMFRGTAIELVEFAECDEFVAATWAQAKLLERSFDPARCPQMQRPRFLSVDYGGRVKSWSPGRVGLRASRIHRVMVLSDRYAGEEFYHEPAMPDPVAVDWQARLFHRLHAWGYEVLYKPHPSDIGCIPPGFEHRLGVRTFTRPFEEVWHLADAYLLDRPQSSAFGLAFSTGRPVIYVDFGIIEWMPEARKDLAQACAIVEGWFDKEQRAQVDWDALRQAVNAAAVLKSDEFVRKYIPPTLQWSLRSA